MTAEQATIVQAYTNTSGKFFRPYGGSGTSVDITVTTLYDIPAAASGKDLTIDLGGKSVALDFTFLTMNAELSDFELTIKNGTVTSTDIYPVIALQGAGVVFKLDGVTLSKTSQTGNFAYVINDVRHSNSYSILTNSTLTSAHGAAISMMTHGANKNDASLFYYIKDCELGGVKTSYSPAVIMEATSIANDVYRPANSIILDNVTYPTEEKAAPLTNLTASELIEVTAPEAEALPAATVSYGTIANIACADVRQAVKAAELFGRNTTAASKVTLMAETNIESSVSMGVANAGSTFTLDLNGNVLTGEALVEAAGGADTMVTINVTGELGNEDNKLKFFAHANPIVYNDMNHTFVIDKGVLFKEYSLDLEDTVAVNLYTVVEEEVDEVSYTRGAGDKFLTKEVIVNKDETTSHRWQVNELTAKEMKESFDAYAVKTEGTTTTIEQECFH